MQFSSDTLVNVSVDCSWAETRQSTLSAPPDSPLPPTHQVLHFNYFFRNTHIIIDISDGSVFQLSFQFESKDQKLHFQAAKFNLLWCVLSRLKLTNALNDLCCFPGGQMRKFPLLDHPVIRIYQLSEWFRDDGIFFRGRVILWIPLHWRCYSSVNLQWVYRYFLLLGREEDFGCHGQWNYYDCDLCYFENSTEVLDHFWVTSLGLKLL